MEETKIFKIEGMHCTSCAMNIDGELEDMPGVKEARTNYAKQETTVIFTADTISTERIVQAIERVGYKVSGTR